MSWLDLPYIGVVLQSQLTSSSYLAVYLAIDFGFCFVLLFVDLFRCVLGWCVLVLCSCYFSVFLFGFLFLDCFVSLSFDVYGFFLASFLFICFKRYCLFSLLLFYLLVGCFEKATVHSPFCFWLADAQYVLSPGAHVAYCSRISSNMACTVTSWGASEVRFRGETL